MAGETRARMIEATVAALQRRGVAGMSFTEVLASSGAARGAIYHHFPGGKAQLVAEAARANAQEVADHFAALPASSPRAVVEGFFALVRPVVAASAAGGGCAVAAVTVESGSDADAADMRQVAAAAFSAWTDRLADRLVVAGLASGEAADLAGTLVTLLEGVHVLCRAAGGLEPFEQVVRAAGVLVACRFPD